MALYDVLELTKGQIVIMDKEYYRVIGVEKKAGVAQMAPVVVIRLLRLSQGTVVERRMNVGERVEVLETQRMDLQFLYQDGSEYVFMHPETFEQYSISPGVLGKFTHYLKEGQMLPVEFYEGNPIDAVIPDRIAIRVESTAEARARKEGDNTFKPAILENGMEIMVPQFIKPGDQILIEVESGKYVERLR
ncbi:MAG: hypothetical protein ACK4G3_04455 [bacterium]